MRTHILKPELARFDGCLAGKTVNRGMSWCFAS